MAERSFRNVRKIRKHLKFETLSDGGLTEHICWQQATEPCKELGTKAERLVLKGRDLFLCKVGEMPGCDCASYTPEAIAAKTKEAE